MKTYFVAIVLQTRILLNNKRILDIDVGHVTCGC